MLVLSRKLGESIVIGGGITVTGKKNEGQCRAIGNRGFQGDSDSSERTSGANPRELKGLGCAKGVFMVTTLLPPESGASVPNDWFCELSSDRSADECPNCKQLAMQFHAKIHGEPEQENVFRCCACGSIWQF